MMLYQAVLLVCRGVLVMTCFDATLSGCVVGVQGELVMCCDAAVSGCIVGVQGGVGDDVLR